MAGLKKFGKGLNPKSTGLVQGPGLANAPKKSFGRKKR